MRAKLVLAALAGGLLGAVGAPPALAEVEWLCHPGLADDPCEIPLDTTVREHDGSDRVETPARQPQERRPIDCFYVYPTVSNQPTPNSTKARDPELLSIAKYQAARFSTQCRIYAPIYRQRTIAAIATASREQEAESYRVAYGDVVEAWREYLARHNGGRGVALIGHSQGTRMLRALIKFEIDPQATLRRRFVGGVLLGNNVTVPRGRAVGGDFRHIPICTRRGEHACVAAFSSFAEDPPDNPRYGKPPAEGDPDPFDFPKGDRYEIACTDPARLTGMTAPFGVTIPSEPFAPGVIAVGNVVTAGGAPPSAPTTWVTSADRYQGSCRTVNGANVLRYDPLPGSRRPNYFPDRTWGTHLIDMNLGFERQVAIVAGQAEVWLRQRAGGSSSCAPKRRLRVSVWPRTAARGVPTRFRFRVRRTVNGRRLAIAGARVRFAGVTVVTNRRGRATRAVTLRRAGTYPVRAFRQRLCAGRAEVRARAPAR